VDRGKQGLKRSVLSEGQGLPVQLVAAGAKRHDSPLLAPTLAGLDKVAPLTAAEPGAVQLDRGYDNDPTRELLAEVGLDGIIARTGVPAPIQAGSRWKVERTHAWMSGYGKLRRCTEKRKVVVDFYLFLAATLVVLRRLIQEARTRYRWPGRPTVRRLT
jgi:transposase